jgi:VWFA-related protein
MKYLKAALPVLMSGILAAQTPPPPAQKTQAEDSDLILKSQSVTIVAPTLVTDRQGNIIDGLQPAQFHLFDNGKEQNINVDVTFEPISLVIALECSGRLDDSILRQMKHIGSLTQEIIGTSGEAAVMKFDGRLMVMQDFTKDPDKVAVAINKINLGNSQSRMVDAVESGVRMLQSRPKGNRRIILLVSETRDEGSEARLRETLIAANFANVTVYCVDITQLAVRLMEKQPDPRPVNMDPTTMNNPMGQPNTPTTMQQNYGMGNRAQFVPLLKEIYTDAKGIFVKDPAKQLTLQTGGEHFYFLKQKGLEDAVERIGQQLHSQYLITYTPNNFSEPGFHTIEVTIDRSQLIAKTRPGYWVGGGKQ